jgi:hypothetical protein
MHPLSNCGLLGRPPPPNNVVPCLFFVCFSLPAARTLWRQQRDGGSPPTACWTLRPCTAMGSTLSCFYFRKLSLPLAQTDSSPQPRLRLMHIRYGHKFYSGRRMWGGYVFPFPAFRLPPQTASPSASRSNAGTTSPHRPPHRPPRRYHLACPSADFPANYTDLMSDPVYVVMLLFPQAQLPSAS